MQLFNSFARWKAQFKRLRQFALLSTRVRCRLFSLIIGINDYASDNISSLKGAVADARAFRAYLHDQLHVPYDHITILEDQTATRLAIIEAIQSFVNDSRIRHGDCIVIYYAGHGSEADAPPGWETKGPNAKIQLILPHDALCDSGGRVVPPLPGRTLGALIDGVAQEKGENIVVILDSCCSASGTRMFNDPADFVRSVPLPSNLSISADLDQDIWSSPVNYYGSRSHILLAACGPSGKAYESDARGVFTNALLDLFQNTDINNLRYRDIPVRINVDSRQSPHCVGYNPERSIFNSSSLSLPRTFIPIYAKKEKKKEIRHTYILNGGAAHGLATGDEFAVYPDMDSPDSEGTLVVDELYPFYSIMRPLDNRPTISGNSIATRIEKGNPQATRIYVHPEDKVAVILSLLKDNKDDLSSIDIINGPKDAQIHVAVREDHLFFRFEHMGKSNLGFRVEHLAGELMRILKASSVFISELNRTAVFPEIARHVQLEVLEFQSQLPRTPINPQGAITYRSYPLRLRQGGLYSLRLTNDSSYDLYPIVQYFHPTNEFKFDTIYEPAFSRSMLDVPLERHGGTLDIRRCSGGSTLVIPSADEEDVGYLKISLFTHPPDPFYQAAEFRLARYLPKALTGPWATIVVPVIHATSPHPHYPVDHPPGLPMGLRLAPTLFSWCLRRRRNRERSSKPYKGLTKGLTKGPPFGDPDEPPGEEGLKWFNGIRRRTKSLLSSPPRDSTDHTTHSFRSR